LFGKPDDEVDALMDPLLDWIDVDDDRRPEGAENADYEALQEPYASRNGPLRTLGELTLVRGWEEFRKIQHEDGTALTDCLTVGPTGGRININTASPLVLQTLNEKIDESIVSEILSRREELAFDDTEDLYVLLNFLTNAERTFITGHIQSQSSLLSLRSEGAYRRMVSRLEVRVAKDDEGYRVTRWRIE
jgi:general secretion pathway protein K